jgi:hypothetical protein
MPIRGLDALHRTLDDAKGALAALEGQFGFVRLSLPMLRVFREQLLLWKQ